MAALIGGYTGNGGNLIFSLKLGIIKSIMVLHNSNVWQLVVIITVNKLTVSNAYNFESVQLHENFYFKNCIQSGFSISKYMFSPKLNAFKGISV